MAAPSFRVFAFATTQSHDYPHRIRLLDCPHTKIVGSEEIDRLARVPHAYLNGIKFEYPSDRSCVILGLRIDIPKDPITYINFVHADENLLQSLYVFTIDLPEQKPATSDRKPPHPASEEEENVQ